MVGIMPFAQKGDGGIKHQAQFEQKHEVLQGKRDWVKENGIKPNLTLVKA